MRLDQTLFRADGQWHSLGHGIEIMATGDMWAGTFWVRTEETPAAGKRAGGSGSHVAERSEEIPADRAVDAGGSEDRP